MRGRKPKPTTLKLIDGNPGRRPLNANEPHPDALDTDLPLELEDPLAQEEWRRTIVPAIDTGQITAADRMFAVAHCELWATWRSQVAAAAQHAHVVAVGKNKRPMANPARGMANRTLLLLAKIDAELGLSPTSRSRITVSPRKPRADNPLAKFMPKGVAK